MKSLAKAFRWGTAALAVAALLGPAAGVASAATPVTAVVPVTPVSGNEATITVGVGEATPAVSPDGGKAYVAAVDGNNQLVLKTVDTQADAVIGQLVLGTWQGRPFLALSADGSRLYVLNGLSLTVVDTASLTALASVTVPDQPRPTGWSAGSTEGLALSPDGSTLYVAQNGPQTYRQEGQSRVLEFATAQRAFTTQVQLTASELGSVVVRPGSHDVYVGSSSGVYHLSTAGAAPSLVGVVSGTAAATAGDYELAFTPDGTRLFTVSGTGTGAGALINPDTDTVTTNLRLLSPDGDLEYPQVSADGSRLYLVDNDLTNGPSVLVFDATTGAALPDETVSGLDESNVDGLALGPDGDTMYVTGSTSPNSALQIINY
ncbi:hypothetical protein [Kitasatospora kifunensis]|uniref:YVTN family beta-propeller protein n=1 Tax=Kitasatospora kifunensis TaxID=58351 RepID=A0A7W7QWF6_KITKI|nr:hypothetical protein [Kitasatospora kifunensis]MBB4921051.1 YVTN family beta-propeller protein [Kitasatospora kifunensis]